MDHFGGTSLYVPTLVTNPSRKGLKALLPIREAREGTTAIKTWNASNRKRIMAIR